MSVAVRVIGTGGGLGTSSTCHVRRRGDRRRHSSWLSHWRPPWRWPPFPPRHADLARIRIRPSHPLAAPAVLSGLTSVLPLDLDRSGV